MRCHGRRQTSPNPPNTTKIRPRCSSPLSSFFSLWFLLIYSRFDPLHPDSTSIRPPTINLTLNIAPSCRSRAAVFIHPLPQSSTPTSSSG
ncbi:hypothetical protein NL676_008064 [Syzygium grande]|nr:hypothetical protein NL676_008064 [Syzygium grande]